MSADGPDTPEAIRRREELAETVTELGNLVEVLHTGVQKAEERAAEAEARADQAEQRVDELEAELDQLRDRTNLLDKVKQTTALRPAERAGVLIQTLHARASRGDGRAAMDVSTAVDVLGGDIDRTLVYKDFQTAEDLIDDQDVLEYRTESRASSKNSRLILDLEVGDLPACEDGVQLTEGR